MEPDGQEHILRDRKSSSEEISFCLLTGILEIQQIIAKLSSSSVPVQSNLNWDLALNLVITTHPPS